MKKLLAIVLFFQAVAVAGQTDEQKLTATVKEFHQSLVNGAIVSINQQTDKALTYGHSNGWVETKTDMIRNLETGYLDYNSFEEDSMKVTVNGTLAHARFVANINVTMNGNTATYRLKVLEVWVRKGKRWILFARQAVRG
ncbi:MAG: nuclear transport factor 2 family protein [Chitinophagaceae bacterium]|nr:nuclear transport factor 2 family protein [Chitinophagaceae bacterium]